MRKILSYLAVIIIVLGLVVIGTPGLMGITAAKKYPNLVKQLNQSPVVSVKLVKFDRGWFQSTAQLQVTVKNGVAQHDEANTTLPQFTISQTLKHGPVTIIKQSDDSKKLIFARAVIISTIPHLDHNVPIIWTLGGALKLDIQQPTIKFANDDLSLTADNLEGHFTYSPGQQRVNTDLQLENASLSFTQPDSNGQSSDSAANTTTSLQNLTIKTDTHQNGDSPLWYGIQQFKLDKLSIAVPDTPTLTFTGLQLKGQQTEKGDNTNITLNNKIDSIEHKPMTWQDFKFAFSAKDLNSSALAQLVKTSEANGVLAQASAYPAGLSLITKGFTVELNQLNFTTPEGKVNAHAQIVLPKKANKEADTNDPLYLMTFVNRIHANAELHLPKPLLAKWLMHFYQQQSDIKDVQQAANNHLQHWISHNILLDSNNQLSLKLSFKDGKLLINGKNPKMSDYLVDDKTAQQSAKPQQETTNDQAGNTGTNAAGVPSSIQKPPADEAGVIMPLSADNQDSNKPTSDASVPTQSN